MSYKFLINGDETPNIISPEWADDLENYANTFSFSTCEYYEIGSLFKIVNKYGYDVLTGIITDFEQSDPNVFHYSGYDCGFYINQNEIIQQLKKIKISDAIKILCKNHSIPVGNIPEMSATVTEIFKDRKLSDVLSQLIEYAISKGCIKDVYYTCAHGKFEILPYETIVDLTGEMSVFSVESQKTINSASVKVSMQELRNKIILADDNETNQRHVIVQDASSISKYGLLQEVETIDTSKANNLNKIASDKLTSLNKLSKSISMSMLGDYRMHKGVIMPIDSEEIGVKGNFLITSSKHNIEGDIEHVAVNLQMYE
jgi:hypothetical protein